MPSSFHFGMFSNQGNKAVRDVLNATIRGRKTWPEVLKRLARLKFKETFETAVMDNAIKYYIDRAIKLNNKQMMVSALD